MLYRNILKQSLRITWRNKYLWFFGLFAALITGEGQVLIHEFGNNSSQSFLEGLKNFAETGIFSSNALENIGILLKSDFVAMTILFIVGLIILILLAFLLWLSVISQVALIKESANIIINKIKTKSSGIKNGIIGSANKFWPVFGLNLIIKIAIFTIFILINLPIIFTVANSNFSANLLYVILFVFFMPVAIIFSFIIKYGICFIVIKNNSFLDSIKNGWNLFANNWLVSIEVSFVLFFINFFAGLGAILLIVILSIPFLFLILLFYELMSLAGSLVMIFLSLIVFLFIIMAVGSGLTVFQTASWTGLFIKLADGGIESKIMRIVGKFRK